MQTKALVLSLAVLFVAVAAIVGAEEVNLGTWKLNEGKSKISGMAKNTTVVCEAAGDSLKVTVDGVDATGKPTHNEWTGKFDGKEYPVTGNSTSGTRSYKRINTHTLELTDKSDGKVTITGKITVSADGKSRTVAITTVDASGKKSSSTYVYDKQ
jgi:hypothetical protein